jgi:uncharacterized repeat protein (TIGR01451 family)
MKSIRWGFVLVAPLALLPPAHAQGLTLEWAWTTAGSGDPFPNYVHVVSTPLVMDMNADGTPDVVFTATDPSSGNATLPGVVRIVSGDDGHGLFVPGVLVNATCTVALGDIDGDGRPEIVAVDEVGARLQVLEHDGTLKWKANWTLSDFCAAGAPSLADLDGDGTPEIVMGRQAVRNDGTLLWTGTGTSGKQILGPHSVVVDLDLDGAPEVLAGSTAYTAGGGVRWTNPAPDGFTAVANLDGDSFPEVVLVEGGRVRLLDGETGATRWGPMSIPGGGLGGPPTLADLDGDGTPEIAVSSASQLAVFEADGQLKWNVTISDATSQRLGSGAFDLDGDGAAEIVHRDEHFLRVFRGSDGAVLRQTALSSCTWTEYPTVADVDGDGSAEIVVGANSNCGLGSDRGVFTFESAGASWGPARRMWNEYAYHVTNVNDDGSIPSLERRHWLFLNGFRQNSSSGTTSRADFSVSQSDDPDPQFEGQPIDYHVVVTNLGPDRAAATLMDTIPSGSVLVGAVPSQGTCGQSVGILTCDLGEIAPGADANVRVTVAAPPGWANALNVATVTIAPPGIDPEAANNAASQSTQVAATNIGDFVWRDDDADGIRDPNEPGVADVVVLLYDGVGGLIGSAETNGNGYYALMQPVYGVLYNLRFVLPDGFVFAPRDQGSDDTMDSDADPFTGETIVFPLADVADTGRWDAGLVPDADGDGSFPPADCNDAEPAVRPGAVEHCNGRDDDCDGRVDESCDAVCDVPAEIGDEVDLTPTATNAGAPRIVWTGSEYGMVVSDNREGNYEIYLTRFDVAFARIGGDVRVTSAIGTSSSPYLAWTGTEYGVAWQDDRDGNYEIYFARLDAAGNKIGADVRVTSVEGVSQRPRLAWSGVSYGLLWNDVRDGTSQNYFLELDAAGNPVGTERRLTPLPYSAPSGRFDWTGSVYGVVYGAVRDGTQHVWFQTLDRHGNFVTPETSVTSSTGVIRTPAIAWDGISQFGISWVDNRSGAEQIFFTRVAADGTKLTGDHPLVAIVSTASIPQMLVHSGGEWALTWIDQAVGNAEIYFGRIAGDALADVPLRVTDHPATAQNPALAWNGTEYAIAFAENRAGASTYHAYASRIGCCTVSTLGDRVWRDADVDGIQDPGETGVSGTLVAVYDGTGALLGASASGADGAYQLTGLSCGSTYELRFFPPGSEYLSPQHQGADDALDSDPDPATGSTGSFVLTSSADAAGWDAGIAACWPPDEPVYIASVGRTGDGNNYPILNFQDPNQPEQTTGYDVYRSATAGAAWPWPLVATDVVDMDAATPNLQWVDTSGDVSPTGAWYYQVTAYNHRCPAEGPR